MHAIWNGLNNPEIASANILTDSDISIEHHPQGNVIRMTVPRAPRNVKPVYVHGNPKTGTYRRNGEGDYRCSEEEYRALTRDSLADGSDRTIIAELGTDSLSQDTIRAYRAAFDAQRPGHPWHDLTTEEFLTRLGALGRLASDPRLHPSRAGLLMFGHEYDITSEFPQYFLDYREVFGDNRWDDRIISSSGTWSGNLYDFHRMVGPKLTQAARHPFQLAANMTRSDDNPMDAAIREALLNTLVHADYLGRRGTVIIRRNGLIEFANPGALRLSPEEVEGGGISDTRNPLIMKMFNLVGAGEKAGSGFDTMRAGARFAHAAPPSLSETFNPDRVTLTLHTTGESVGIDDLSARTTAQPETKATPLTAASTPSLSAQERVVTAWLQRHESATTNEIANQLGVSPARGRAILGSMADKGIITATGERKARRYHLPS